MAKVVYTMETVDLNNLTSVRMTPPSIQIPTLDFVDRGYLDGENDTLESQVLCKSCREGSGKVQVRFREGSGKLPGSRPRLNQNPALIAA